MVALVGLVWCAGSVAVLDWVRSEKCNLNQILML
jgi:hypothetical protein